MAGTVVYSDSNLLLADYNIVQGTSNGSVSFSNAGGAFTASRTIGAGGGFANFAAINPSFVYGTGMGTLNSIDVSALLTTTNSPWALFIQQGGTLYRAAITTPTGTNQLSSASGLTASSFAEIDLTTNTFGAGTPDFDSSFDLGFGQRLFSNVASSNSITFDDLSITLNVTPTPIPEPASITLLGGALLAMAARRWTRRRS